MNGRVQALPWHAGFENILRAAQRFLRAFRAIARRRWLAIAICGLLPVVLRLAILPVLPVPQPAVHDEFAYLLEAQTFSAGRLTNPTHPMWQHFETFHELQQPSYTGKYPPLQGLALAMGKRLFGHPWAGVVLSMGALFAAICWMLQAYLPPAWALLGTLIGIVQFGVLSYWMNSYWGGAVAGIGGSLLLGALARLRSSHRPVHAVVFAIGISILANSRPYEGLVLTLTCGCILVFYSIRQRWFGWLFPVAAVLAVTFGLMAYYNLRVTGSPLTLPYQAYERQYATSSVFVSFQAPAPLPAYRHKIMQDFYEWDLGVYHQMMSHPWRCNMYKLRVFFLFFLGRWQLIAGLVMLPFLITSRRARVPLLIVAVYLIGLGLEKAILPHYLAPITGLILLLLMLGFHLLRLWNTDHKPTGSILFKVAVITLFLQFLAQLPHPGEVDLTGREEFRSARASIIHRLAEGRFHLVFVHYAPNHDFHQEWVYNEADLDKAHILWAREMNPTEDRKLVDYFHSRDVWVLQPDLPQPILTKYSGPNEAVPLSHR